MRGERRQHPMRVGIWNSGGPWGVFMGDDWDGVGFSLTVQETENLIRRLADQMRLARKRNKEERRDDGVGRTDRTYTGQPVAAGPIGQEAAALQVFNPAPLPNREDN